jgi:hypothetical protein
MSKERRKIEAWVRDHAIRRSGWDPPISDYWLGQFTSTARPRELSQQEKEEVVLEVFWKFISWARLHRADPDYQERYSEVEKRFIEKAAVFGVDESTYYHTLTILIRRGDLWSEKKNTQTRRKRNPH